jgi:hypothetical protein
LGCPADTFVDKSSGSDSELGWKPPSVAVLDDFVAALGADDSVLGFIGAYFGES